MILYKKEPYPIQMRNIMLLDDAESGGVVYVNKTTYDQALLLSSRLDRDPKRVLSLITCPANNAYIATFGLKALVEKMMATMPKPLNMLAPFLINCAANQGIEWNADDREFAYGILHQFSQLYDFNAITLVPVEVRNAIQLPTVMLKEYKTSWDDLCSTLEDKLMLAPTQPVQQVQMIQMPAPAPVVPTNIQVSTPAPAPVAQPTASTDTPNVSDDAAERIRKIQERMKKEMDGKAKAAQAKSVSSGLAAKSAETKGTGESKQAALLDEYEGI